MPRIHFPLEKPLFLFLLSAVCGVIVSYSPGASLVDFGLVLVGLALYAAIASFGMSRRFLTAVTFGLLFGSALLTIYFVATSDFANRPIKFSTVTHLGIYLNRLFPLLFLPSLQPNNLAGILELVLPVAVALAIHSARSHAWTKLVGATFLAFVIAAGIGLSGSRGAWLALGAVGTLSLVTWIGSTRQAPTRIVRVLIPCFIIGALGVLLFAMSFPESLRPIWDEILSLGNPQANS